MLVAAAQQNHDFRAAFDIVDAISRAVIDPHFEYAALNRAVVTEIPDRRPLDPVGDPGPRLAVAEAREPSGKVECFLQREGLSFI